MRTFLSATARNRGVENPASVGGAPDSDWMPEASPACSRCVARSATTGHRAQKGPHPGGVTDAWRRFAETKGGRGFQPAHPRGIAGVSPGSRAVVIGILFDPSGIARFFSGFRWWRSAPHTGYPLCSLREPRLPRLPAGVPSGNPNGCRRHRQHVAGRWSNSDTTGHGPKRALAPVG